jgi:heat shock factor-binding protein 1
MADSTVGTDRTEAQNVEELTNFIQLLLQQMQDKFQSTSDQIIARIDQMGQRVDELEKTITDLMTQTGAEEK